MLDGLRIERVARDATVSHFLLMFGYKLFSFFFPLFLAGRGMSLSEVGYTYLLIYVPIAFAAPVVGTITHRVNPALLAALGIAGYGAYAAGMMVIQDSVLFFLWQVMLGLSAALAFVSFRALLIGAETTKPAATFGWFYSAPFYAEALAPAIGAGIIWVAGFPGVFLASLAVHLLNAGFALTRLSVPGALLKDKARVQETVANYGHIVRRFASLSVFPILAVSFSVLLVGGVYRAFFVLFLKELGWAEHEILLFGALFAASFLPVSLYAIHMLSRAKSTASVLRGSLLYALVALAFGGFAATLHAAGIFVLMLGRAFGGLLTNSGRSGFISRKFAGHPGEAGALDTVFAPFGSGLGSLAGGLLVGALGFPLLFLGAGAFVAVVTAGAAIAKQRDLS